MPIPGFATTDNGLPYTRFKAPLMSGSIIDSQGSGQVGPIPPAGGVMVIQSTASITNQVVTTSASGLSRASFIYISLTTGTLVGAAAPPYTGVGTPLVWDDTDAILMVWSSSRGAWLNQTVTSSALLVDKKGFTSSV